MTGKKKRKRESLLEGSVLKGFILFALPLFAGSLFQQLYGTVDLIFVGNCLGKTEAAAVYPVIWLIAMLLFIVSYRRCVGRLLQKPDN